MSEDLKSPPGDPEWKELKPQVMGGCSHLGRSQGGQAWCWTVTEVVTA